MNNFSIKIFVLIFLAAWLSQAETNQSQLFSQLMGTTWAGSLQPTLRSIRTLPAMYIEISFLKQHDGSKIGYIFDKDVSTLNRLDTKGLIEVDSVPCYLSNGDQEPRYISLTNFNTGSFSGVIAFNNCKPDKNKRPQKVPGTLPIERFVLSADGNTLDIFVSTGKKRPALDISYTLRRVTDLSTLRLLNGKIK